MVTSGTYNYFASNADAVLAAYARINLRRSSLKIEHFKDAALEANMMLVEFANKQPNLWTSETRTIPLVAGTATYDMLPRDIMILAAYIRTGTGASQLDRILAPVSTTEYAAYTVKNQEGFPSVYWFNRQITPQITLWMVPDASDTYTLYLQVVQQIQDINLANGEQAEIPYRWLDVFIAGLAYRLARIYRPDLEQVRKAEYDEAWRVAGTQDVENVSLFISPGMSSYYRT